MNEAKRNLEMAKQESENILKRTIQKIDALGTMSNGLYESLNSMQDVFDAIRGIPDDKRLQYQHLQKMREAWKRQANEIMIAANEGTKTSSPAMNGVKASLTTIAISPSIAAGLATCFETMSLGLIATGLGGVPTSAVAVAIGTAPIIEPTSLVIAGFIWICIKAETKRAQKLFTRIFDRNNKTYKRVISEINERMKRIDMEKTTLDKGITIISEFGSDYRKMTEEQKIKLGTYFNLLNSSTALVVEPISGLQPYYSDNDFNNYIDYLNGFIYGYESPNLSIAKENKKQSEKDPLVLNRVSAIILKNNVVTNKALLLYLSNLLYKIQLDTSEKRVLCKCLNGNQEFAKTYGLNPKDINEKLIDIVMNMLSHKK